jgi:aspartate aminotransferase
MLSKRVKSVKPSLTLGISAKANEMRRKGIKVLNLAAGEPSFPVADNIKKAGIKAIKGDFTKYTATSGIPELKEAVAKKFRRDNIIVANGGKQILFNAISALANEGDEFIVPKPYWVSYLEQIKLAGSKPVFASTDDFIVKADLIAEKVNRKTKCISLNSPCNPTGAVISIKELKRIADLAIEKGLYVISDEVYEPFTYDSRHHSIASLNNEIKERTITVNSTSKSYAMTGVRIGYCGAPKEMIELMGRIQDHTTSNACSIAQCMALAALKGPQGHIKKMCSSFRRRRDIVVKRLNEMQLDCTMPGGAFYAFPSIRRTRLGSIRFCDKLLTTAKVALVPGIGFGDDKHVRLSFVADEKTIREGLDNMDKFMRCYR